MVISVLVVKAAVLYVLQALGVYLLIIVPQQLVNRVITLLVVNKTAFLVPQDIDAPVDQLRL